MDIDRIMAAVIAAKTLKGLFDSISRIAIMMRALDAIEFVKIQAASFTAVDS